MALLEENIPKHMITHSKAFQKGKEHLGNLILKNMDITGGTDVDWLIERKGGFLILETKLMREDHVTIPLGQMIAFESLYEKLSSDGKCYFYIFANEESTDYTNPESLVWYFDMSEWKKKKIPQNKTSTGRYYRIKRDVMAKIPLKHFRILMEDHWREFGKTKIDSKPNSKVSTIKKKSNQVIEAQKKHRRAYESWTESDDELLKKFWKQNKQSKEQKILELEEIFGRNRGAIISRLKKVGFQIYGNS